MNSTELYKWLLEKGVLFEQKDCVCPDDIKPETIYAVLVCAAIYERHGKKLVVTSLNDGTHMIGSKHYEGYATDTRTFYFTKSQVDVTLLEIREALGKDYDVLFEKNHFHIEYDPK